MEREILLTIATRLRNEYIVSFRLYNALYKITFSKNGYSIHQEGLDISYHYRTLKELFEQYVVYGDSLKDLLEDIKLS